MHLLQINYIYDLFFGGLFRFLYYSVYKFQKRKIIRARTCSNLSRYNIKNTLAHSFQINSCVIYGFSQSESQKKSKVSCLDTISSVDWQKFENTRHLACGALLKKVMTNSKVLFCVAFNKVRWDFTSSA